MKRRITILAGILIALACHKRGRPALPYGYNGCLVAAQQQAEHLRRGEKSKFRYMMLDRDTFTRMVYPRLVGYKGTNAEDVWNLTAFEIERSTDRAFEELKGATSISVAPPKQIEEHDGMKIYRNFEMIVGAGANATGEPIVQKNDKILSALVEIDGFCRHWVNAYKD